MQDNTLIKKVKIVGIVEETSQSKTFLLQPVGDWQLSYEPGQFITLVFYTEHGEKRRSYSFSSSPVLSETPSITIKKVDNGEFSRKLIYYAQVGDELFTSGVSGFFQLPEKISSEKQFFFLAAGSGITPCFSLIKTILVRTSQTVTLIYSNKSESDAIFYKQLQDLQAQYAGRLVVHFLFSNKFDVFHSRLSKWLLLQLLKTQLEGDKKNLLFYLCGPYDYMQTISITLLGTSVPSENIIREHFNTLPRKVIPRPPDTDAHTVRIHIGGKVHTLVTQYPQTILAAAKAAHIELPYSCEAGRCGSCTATCTKGKVWMAYNEVLTDNEVDKGRVLTCQGFPIAGDAEIVF